MQELRSVFIEMEQPTLVKSIRLVCEFAEAFDGFAIDLWEAEGGLSSLSIFWDFWKIHTTNTTVKR
jgi:hypothetical protein